MTTSHFPIQTFDFKDTPVRVAGTPENALFVAADVCRVLEIENTSHAVHGRPGRRNDLGLSEDEKGVASVTTPSGEQKMLCVTEPGLFRLIFKSRKPQAKEFQRWVCHEVLPSIRKNGFYLNSAIDFQKYPLCEDFSNIFVWLRSLDVDPNESASVARSLLVTHIKESARASKPLPDTQDRSFDEFSDLVREISVNSAKVPLTLSQILFFARDNFLLPSIVNLRVDDRGRVIRLGKLLNRYARYEIGGHYLQITGSKNWRRYIFTPVASA